MLTTLQCLLIVSGYMVGWLIWDFVPRLLLNKWRQSHWANVMFGFSSAVATYTLTLYPLRYLWDR